MKKLESFLKKEKNQLIIVTILIFVSMLILNFITPLLADDYSYSFGVDGKLETFFDVIEKQVNHYFTWGGRSVAHTIAQTFLLSSKTIFNVFNTAVYTLLVWLIYLHAKSNNKNHYPLLLLLIHLGLWFILPVFGQNCLWLIGSCNYLWTTTIILIFLYILRFSKKDFKLKSFAILLLGILAGWTNENTAFGLITATTILLLIDKFEHKKLNKWKWFGLAGTIIGFLILIIAPGNYVRSNAVDEGASIIFKLFSRTVNYTVATIEYLKPLIIITIILFTIYMYNKKKIDKFVYAFLAASILSIYAMVLSPTFPERAWFGIIVFMIIADLSLMYNIFNKRIYKYLLSSATVLLFIIYSGQFIIAAKEIYQLNAVWNYRKEYIEKEKNNKRYDIKLTPFISYDKHNPAYGLDDINKGTDVWINKDLAKYFAINSIEAKQE